MAEIIIAGFKSISLAILPTLFGCFLKSAKQHNRAMLPTRGLIGLLRSMAGKTGRKLRKRKAYTIPGNKKSAFSLRGQKTTELTQA